MLVGGQDIDEKINDLFKNPSSESTTAKLNLQPNIGIPGIDACTCVPYYLCNNGTIITSGEGLIDIR